MSSMEDEALKQFKKDIAALTNVSGMSKRQKTENGRLFILGQGVSASPSLQTESEHKASLCSDCKSYIRAQKTAWEPMSECIEFLPANSYGAAVQRIPLEVWRLRDDDDPKEWSSSVRWATNLLNVVNPHFVRRSERRVGPKANTGKTV